MTGTVLAGVLSGMVAALITLSGVLLTNRWRIAEDNIIKQRTEWRQAIRRLIAQSVNVSSADEARRIWVQIALRMNPEDDAQKDDRELVALIKSLESPQHRNDAVRRRIVELAANILKHDWTRAKWEANGWFWEDEPKQTRSPKSADRRAKDALTFGLGWHETSKYQLLTECSQSSSMPSP